MMDKFAFESKPGETPLDDTSGLLPKHVTTREALNRAEFANINKVLPKYFLKESGPKNALFNYQWFLTLHREMFDDVWDWAGKIRSTNVNIGVDPVKIPSELHRAVYDLNLWEKEKRSVGEISALLHHRLVWVHPFPGGNGRWARMAVDIYLKKNGCEVMNWPSDPNLIQESFRNKYITALKEADLGNYKLILALHEEYFNAHS